MASLAQVDSAMGSGGTVTSPKYGDRVTKVRGAGNRRFLPVPLVQMWVLAV